MGQSWRNHGAIMEQLERQSGRAEGRQQPTDTITSYCHNRRLLGVSCQHEYNYRYNPTVTILRLHRRLLGIEFASARDEIRQRLHHHGANLLDAARRVRQCHPRRVDSTRVLSHTRRHGTLGRRLGRHEASDAILLQRVTVCNGM